MEAIGTPAGGIAHDFNNILFPIMGYGEMILNEAEPMAGISQYAQKINQSAERTAGLVQQILTFSRHDKQDLRPLMPAPIVKEVLKFIRASIPSTIKIASEIDQNCSPIMGNPTQLHQILINLCTNAFHSMRKTGGTIEVNLDQIILDGSQNDTNATLAPGPYVRLIVKDTGHGMPSSTLDRIFEPYFTTKEKEEGTGSGLAIVHSIVEEYQGKIEVASKVNQGTSFTIYLPVTQYVESCEIKSTQEIEPKGGNEHILIVDDEGDILSFLKDFLSHQGYRVSTEIDCLKALETLRQDPYMYDLVITDYTMPKLTGCQLTQEMLAIRQDLPIILCSGYREQISDREIMEIGVRKFINKPINQKKLIATIRAIMEDPAGKKTRKLS